jgi:hypothetical protein
MTAWYRTGTVTATNGSGAVTGNLTAWLANAKVGDIFYPDADSKGYEITAVGSNTSITVSPVYAGSTGSGKAYGIARTSPAWNSASELSVKIAQFISTFDPLGLSQLYDPNADRIPFWDESSGAAGAMGWLTLSGLGISGTTMSVDANLISTARWPTSALVAATTTDIGSEAAPIVTVSGNTGITSFGNQPNRFRIVRFTGTPTITHNGTTLVLPGATNLAVTANSVHVFASDVSGNWRWLWSSAPLSASVSYAQIQNVSATDKILGRSTAGAGVVEEIACTAAGRALLDDATAADQLTTLGVSAFIKTLVDDTTAAEAQATLGLREVLSANRSYYVRTDGNDANTGLANTSGGAFLTIQKALDVAAALDTSIYGITINVGAGTYNTAQTLKSPGGGGLIAVVGAGATTIIDPPAGVNHCFQAIAGGRYSLTNMKLQKSTATTGHGIFAEGGFTAINYSGIEFGAMNGGGGGGRHIYVNKGAAISATGAYTITGAALYHFAAASGGNIFCNQAVTLTGTPAFTRFADASLGGTMRVDGTYSGAATGVRYLADSNSVIWTVGGGASFLPGNSAGSVSNGGQYL